MPYYALLRARTSLRARTNRESNADFFSTDPRPGATKVAHEVAARFATFACTSLDIAVREGFHQASMPCEHCCSMDFHQSSIILFHHPGRCALLRAPRICVLKHIALTSGVTPLGGGLRAVRTRPVQYGRRPWRSGAAHTFSARPSR